MFPGRREWWLLFPILPPAILFAAGNENFGFDPEGWLDAFMYVGYFWHYPEHLPVFEEHYKISRLPWILPGYAVHTLLGVTAGPYVLGYLTLMVGALAVYLLVRDALNDRTVAAVVAVAFACCTQAHGVGGWAYHMLAAAGYYLMACWFVLRAAMGPSPAMAAMLGGVFFAAAVHTHLFLVVFAPFLALLHWAALPRPLEASWRRCVRDALLLVCGGLALTLVLGSVHGATGGDWLFFMPQIEQAVRLSESGQDTWWIGDAGRWVPTAFHLVLPVAFLVAGLPVLLSRGKGRAARLARVFVVQAWMAFALMVFFQFGRQQTTLDYNYMAFAVYLHAFPSVAAALASWRGGTCRERPVVAVIATAVVLGALLFLLPALLPQWMYTLSVSAGLDTLPPIVAPLMAAVVGVAVMLILPGRARVVVFAVWFSVVNAWVAPSPSAYGMDTPGTRQQMLTLFREADQFTTDLDPTLLGIKYWISSDRLGTPEGDVDLAAVFNSFVATRAWLTNLLARSSPGVPIEQLTAGVFERGPCIGLLSSIETHTGLQQHMTAHFERLGHPLQHVATRRFERPDLSFALTVFASSSFASRRAARGGGSAPPCFP